MKQHLPWLLIAVLTANAVVTWFMIDIRPNNVDVVMQEAVAARELEIASRHRSALNRMEEAFGVPQSNPQSIDELIMGYFRAFGKVSGYPTR